MTATTLTARIIQVCAGGEIVPSPSAIKLNRLEAPQLVAIVIRREDLPEVTAIPSELILVELEGRSSTFVYDHYTKFSEHSFSFTYLNRDNPLELIRYIAIS